MSKHLSIINLISTMPWAQKLRLILGSLILMSLSCNSNTENSDLSESLRLGDMDSKLTQEVTNACLSVDREKSQTQGAQYNVISFTTYDNLHHVSGTVAVHLDVSADGFGINHDGHPGPALVTKNQTKLKHGQIDGHVFNHAATPFPGNDAVNIINGQVKSWDVSVFDFNSAEDFYKSWAIELCNLNTKAQLLGKTHLGSPCSGANCCSAENRTSMLLKGQHATLNVFNVNIADMCRVNELKFEVNPSAFNLVCIQGENNAKKHNTILMHDFHTFNVKPEKLLWVAPKSHQINISRVQIIGSLLAPLAKITAQNGEQWGRSISKSLEHPDNEAAFEYHMVDLDRCNTLDCAPNGTPDVMPPVFVWPNGPPGTIEVCEWAIPFPQAVELNDENPTCDYFNIDYTQIQTIAGSPMLYELERIWETEDCCGNTAKFTRKIKVKDCCTSSFTAPILSQYPTDLRVCPDINIPDPPEITAISQLQDCQDENVVLTFAEITEAIDDPLNHPNIDYIIKRTWEAVDCCGNSHTYTYWIYVKKECS